MAQRPRARIRQNPPATAAVRQSVEFPMAFTLDLWRDGPWYLGQLRELPDVYSQAKSLRELRENIREVFDLMLKERALQIERRRRRPRAPLGV